MQSAPLEQPAKRPRCDGSPRTPPSTPPATANLSADDDFQNTDLRTWEPEDVCSFLENRGFREKKVLDIFRDNKIAGSFLPFLDEDRLEDLGVRYLMIPFMATLSSTLSLSESSTHLSSSDFAISSSWGAATMFSLERPTIASNTVSEWGT
uniref:SAM domain and HD domain, 1 n=1 Tax=Mus musculus TaxID=10090 RepID=E0CXZ5_MOUSE